MQLHYFVPFKAQEGVSAEYALKEKLLNIEGCALDSTVNLNKWQIPSEDLDFVVESLLGAQLRVDHAESALMVVGKVTAAKRVGDTVTFTAEVGDENLIEKIIRNYVTHVSIQVDSEDVECSKCKRLTRKEGVLIHLCPGAYEVVHKPKVRELSIVASPAYKNTSFVPVGFAAAMNEDQWAAVLGRVADSTDSQLLNSNKDVGSKGDLQEPENKNDETKQEVKHLSEQKTAQKEASPHKAQIVNVGESETAPKQVDYTDFLKKLEQLKQQMHEAEAAEGDAEIDTLKKRVAAMEADIAKKATKRQLSRKLSELSKKISEESEESEEDEQDEDGPKPTGPVDVVSKRKKGEAQEAEASEEAEGQEAEASKASKTPYGAGKGIVAVDEVQKDALGNFDWFKDLLKAHSRLVGVK